jgi:indolepyruvate decarboxylase
VRDFVEKSDCLVVLGEIFTDLSLNCTPNKMKKVTVSCTVGGLKVKNHQYADVHFQDFCKALFKADLTPKKFPKFGYEPVEEQQFVMNPKSRIRTARFFDKVNSILTEDNIILADVGDSLFGASDLICHHKDTFLGSAFYTSMGTAIPGALGVQLAKPNMRPIVLVGDGAFQMSISELSVIASRGLNPIIFVLNNHGYSTERCLADGAFNDIRNWNYHKAVEVIGGGTGFHVTTEEELESAVNQAMGSRELTLINVDVDEGDISASLKRMAATHAKRI